LSNKQNQPKPRQLLFPKVRIRKEAREGLKVKQGDQGDWKQKRGEDRRITIGRMQRTRKKALEKRRTQASKYKRIRL